MKSVLISIQPRWCELIAHGKKTIEVRKTRPKQETPFKAYIYCTKGRGETLWKWDGQYWYDTQFPEERPHRADGKIIGEFVCDGIYAVLAHPTVFAGHPLFFKKAIDDSCLTCDEVEQYSNGKDVYGWHISDLVIYDEPKELSELKKHNRTCYYDHLGLATPKCKDCKDCQITRPPQSWCYVEEG